MNGLQCLRLMWLADRKQLPKPSLSDEHKFAQGHDFEEYVKQLFPKNVDLKDLEFKENLAKTQEALKQKKIIFEAGILFEELFIKTN